MKKIIKIVLVSFLVIFFFKCPAQNISTVSYGKNTLSGRVILKTLVHPIKGTLIKNAMILKLNNKIKFKATEEDEKDVITDEIRIYGDVTKLVNPNKKYKSLIGKRVTIIGNFVYAPSPYYPLPVNIIEDFIYVIK